MARVDGVPRLRAKFLNGQPREAIERHLAKPSLPVTPAAGSPDAHALRGVPMIGLGLGWVGRSLDRSQKPLYWRLSGSGNGNSDANPEDLRLDRAAA